MSPTRSLLVALGCVTALSSCEVFKKDDPAAAEDPYAAANPYTAGAAGAQPQGYPAYGGATTGGPDATNPYGQPAAGSYAPPNYNQPYTQPPAGAYAGNTGAGNAGAGYAGGYSSPAPAGNYGAASGSGRTHTVASGDNLTKIARRYGVSVDALMRANNLNSDLIRQGEKLNIP